MKQIHFDPTNQEAMNALMDEHGKSKTMYPGTNEQGESVYISIFEDKIVTMTSQSNGWMRKNIYYRDGSRGRRHSSDNKEDNTLAKAMLQSRDRDGRHQVPLEDVEILEMVGDNDYIVRTPDGIRCHALFNPFTGFYFADDVYRVVPNQKEETP